MIARANSAIDRMLTAPEANAAGRLGLFRILYALFYLWYLSTQHARQLGNLPPEGIQWRVLIIDWLPTSMPPASFTALESTLVFGLVLLLFGLGTRAATAIVLLAGMVLEACLIRTDYEHGTAMMTGIIPTVMLLLGNWGATYSIDARLQAARGARPVDPRSSDVEHVVPIRAVLVILVLLFVSSGFYKLLPSANWLTAPEKLANVVLDRNLHAVRTGHFGNPFAGLYASIPYLELVTRYIVTALEALFFLALVSRRWRVFFLTWAVLFHALNAVFLLVTFTAILVVYPLFCDLEGWRRRFAGLSAPRLLDRVGGGTLVAVTLAAAFGFAAGWNTTTAVREATSLFGLVNWRTIWIPILPVAAAAWALSIVAFFRSARANP